MSVAGLNKLVIAKLPRNTIIMASGHPLAKLPAVPLAELAGETFIDADPSVKPSAAYLEWWEHFASSLGAKVRYEVVHSTNDLIDLVIAGLGVVLTSRSAPANVTGGQPGLVSKQLADPLPESAAVELSVLWRVDNCSPVLATILEVARVLAAEMADHEHVAEAAAIA